MAHCLHSLRTPETTKTGKEENDPMKTGRLLPPLVLALLAPARAAAESEAAPVPRDSVVLRQTGVPSRARVAESPGIGTLQTGARAAAYSVELPQVARLQGTAFFRTAVDIANNTTNGGVTAQIQYSYTCTACAAGGFFRTTPLTIAFAALDNFHTDDIVQYLDQQGLLVPQAVNGSVGTLLMTFNNLPSANGWEGTALARLYNRVVETDPSQGTIGYAFSASLFFESAHQTLAGTIRDTTPAALANNPQGSQRTNIGIRNTDIVGGSGDRRVTVDVTFYDVTEGSPTNGSRVGNAITFDGLLPGEVRLAGNVFSLAQIPANISSVIAFADVRSPTVSSPTIEGFAVVIDNDATDGSYFDFRCADNPYTCGF
ncbi:MAG: hypothetical protein ACRD3M_18475 [Thermoanaerobaculia bacterium]